MGEDLYKLGQDLFAKKDVIAVRANLKRRLEEKTELRECIMHELTSQPSKAPVDFGGPCNKRAPSWQRALRGKKNNLQLP